MTDSERTAAARRLLGAGHHEFDGYLRGVADFDECCVEAVERLENRIEQMREERD